MAVYEYTCEDCKNVFTISERISEHTEKEQHDCPECGSEKTRRRFSSFFAKTASKT